ncbi:hypothetical protein B0T10DRAFT_486434, partial [Thelonectria olida]
MEKPSPMDYPTELTPSSQPDVPTHRGKPSKACVPCRARKVKCNASVVGLPCSSCSSRQCPESCVLSARKRRKRTVRPLPASNESGRSRSHAPSDQHLRGRQTVAGTPGGSGHTTNSSHPRRADKPHEVVGSSQLHESPDLTDCEDPGQPRPDQADLQYLNILHDAVNDSDTATDQPHGTASNTPFSSKPDNALTPQARPWNKPPQLDDIDEEYLAKKGVFKLPPPHHLDTFLKAFFEYLYPFSPVIERVDFIRSYRSGNCSLFLLRAIMAAATLYVPMDVISECGFGSRSAAQESFFSKANTLHDFHYESDPLSMLQGCIILGSILLDHPTDRDFQYWYTNSIRLAVKLNIRSACTRGDGPCRFVKLYKRIWWVLCNRDVFQSFVNTLNVRFLESAPRIKPITEDDWEAEDVSEGFGLLSPISHQQKASFIAQCELAQISGQCLSAVTQGLQQDPCQLIRPLDAWRMSLADKMQIGDPFHNGDIYYPEALATSYRFESIMCRLIRRHRRYSQDASWSGWAKQRLRSAILEMDTIAKRVLANDTLRKFPINFITTMPALLALHIESALDPSETDLVRAMARISINQTMLVLNEGREIPAIKRALPAFEAVLSKKNLCPVPLNNTEPTSCQSPSDQHSLNETHASPHTDFSMVCSQIGQGEHPSLYGDILGFDFLDGWQIDQLGFAGI